MKALLVLVLLTGLATADDLAAPLQQAITEGRYAEAYQLAGELVAAHPDDPELRYYAAVACLRAARFDEADLHVTAGLAAHADDAPLLGLRASILLFRGDEAGARAAADRSLAIDPDQPDAVEARDEIALGEQARARMGGADPGLPAGSAAAFVDALIAQVAAGEAPATLAEAFDLEILASADPRDRTHDGLVTAIAAALREARKMRDQAGQDFYGWVTVPETQPSGDRTLVDVNVPLVSSVTQRQRDTLAAAAADPALRGTVDPSLLAMIDGVPAAERDALLDRMVGVKTRSLIDLHFEVAGTTGSYRVTDLQFGGISLKAQLGNFSKVMDKVDPPRSRFRLSPEMIGTVVGVVAGIIVLVVLLTRRRR